MVSRSPFQEVGKNREGGIAECPLGRAALDGVEKAERGDLPLARALKERGPARDGPEKRPAAEGIAKAAEDRGADGKEPEKRPTIKEIDGHKHYYDDNGKLYLIDKDLCPNNSYVLDGYHYQTDELGNKKTVEGKLHLTDRPERQPIRDSLEDIGKGDQREGDDRGHLIGDRFGGSNGLENMIPQDAHLNRGDYKKLENEWAKATEEGKKVSCKIELFYEGDSHRPSAIVAAYTIDGVENVRIFNQ